MVKESGFPRLFLIAGHVAMLAWLALAVWFAEERALLIDAAYQLFYDINHESMLINDNRFSMVLSQLLPWLLIKLHVPLRWVVVSYSASFVLLCYGCYILAAHVLKNWKMATLMVFALLGSCATFFHCISETFQLMFYAPLLYALTKSTFRFRWLAMVLVEALAFFIHPVAAFFILFIIGFRMIDGHRLRIDATVVVLAVTLVALVVLKLLVGQSGHDESFMPTGETVKYALTHFFTLSSFGFFRRWFLIYLFPVVLWLLTMVGYARRQQWLKMLYVGLFVAGFFVLSVVVYWQGDGPIGMERTYLPLYFFMGLPFLEDELQQLAGWRRWTVASYFLLMLVIAFVRLGTSFHRYTNRLQEVKQIATYARSQGQQKLLVTRSTADRLFPFNIWGLALESMLYTARDGAENTVTLYMEEDDFDRTDDDLYCNPEVYVSVNWWKRWEVKDLNPHYFVLPPQGYKELTVDAEGQYNLLNICP